MDPPRTPFLTYFLSLFFFLSPSQGALCPLSANVFAFFSPKRPIEREKTKKQKFPEKIREKISIIRQRTEHKSRRSFTEAVEDLHHHNTWTLFKFSNPRRQPLRLCGVKSDLVQSGGITVSSWLPSQVLGRSSRVSAFGNSRLSGLFVECVWLRE